MQRLANGVMARKCKQMQMRAADLSIHVPLQLNPLADLIGRGHRRRSTLIALEYHVDIVSFESEQETSSCVRFELSRKYKIGVFCKRVGQFLVAAP